MNPWPGRAVVALLLAVSVLNLVPGLVALEPARALALYGIALDDPALALVMRHRAVLLAILGALLVAAAFRPALRPAVIVAALASKVAFIALYLLLDVASAPLARVAAIDVGALAALLVAGGLEWRRRRV